MNDWPAAITAGAAVGTGVIAGAAVGARAMFSPGSTLFGPVITRGPSDVPRVALTFDDGPLPGSTDAVLDVLSSFGIRAAFFVIGRCALAHGALVRRAWDEGHLIENHTFDHHRTGMFRHGAYWDGQLAQTQRVVREITGATPTFFRPPMGFKSPPLVRAARRHHCRIVAWSWRGFDGRSTNPESIVARSRRCRWGDIMLLHDGRDPASRRATAATSKALPRLIESLLDRGFEFERLDHLLARSTSPQAPRCSA